MNHYNVLITPVSRGKGSIKIADVNFGTVAALLRMHAGQTDAQIETVKKNLDLFGDVDVNSVFLSFVIAEIG